MGRTLLIFIFLFSCFGLFAQKSADGTLVASGQVLDFSIYPNPSSGYFEIRDLQVENAQIVLYNIVGREMKRFNLVEEDYRYNIIDLPNGLYLVQVLNENRKIISTKRIQKR